MAALPEGFVVGEEKLTEAIVEAEELVVAIEIADDDLDEDDEDIEDDDELMDGDEEIVADLLKVMTLALMMIFYLMSPMLRISG